MSKRIEWARHLWRSNGLIKKTFDGRVDGERPRGRSGQRWIDRVNDDPNKRSQGLSSTESDVVEAAKVLQGP